MELEVWQLVRLARRWWWLLVLGPLVGAGVAMMASAQEVPQYTAVALLRVNPAQVEGVIAYDDLRNTETLAATYRLMAWTRPVLAPVIEELNLNDTLEELGNRLSAWQVQGTQLMQLSVVDPEPQVAADIANAIAASLARHITDEMSELSTTAQSAIGQQIADTQLQIDGVSQQIQALEESPNAANPSSQEQVSVLLTSLDQLEDLRADLLLSAQSMNLDAAISQHQVTIAALAEPPTTSDATNPMLLTLFGALAGALVAGAVVTVLGYLDKTVRATTDLSALVGSPQLSAIPSLGKIQPGTEQLFMLKQPASTAAEAIRLLRIHLELASAVDRIKTLVVSSPEPAEGKSTVAANLAVSLAQTEVTTVLIDADLRNPTLHQLFAVSNDRGLSTMLEHPDQPWRSVAIETPVPNLLVIPSGPQPSNPSDLLSLEWMPILLKEISDEVGVVVLDSPAVAAGSDALVLAAQVDAVMLVARSGQTRLDALQWASQVLAPAGARMLGVVLNRESGRQAGVSGYANEIVSTHDEAPAPVSLEPRRRRRESGSALSNPASNARR